MAVISVSKCCLPFITLYFFVFCPDYSLSNLAIFCSLISFQNVQNVDITFGKFSILVNIDFFLWWIYFSLAKFHILVVPVVLLAHCSLC